MARCLVAWCLAAGSLALGAPRALVQVHGGVLGCLVHLGQGRQRPGTRQPSTQPCTCTRARGAPRARLPATRHQATKHLAMALGAEHPAMHLHQGTRGTEGKAASNQAQGNQAPSHGPGHPGHLGRAVACALSFFPFFPLWFSRPFLFFLFSYAFLQRFSFFSFFSVRFLPGPWACDFF